MSLRWQLEEPRSYLYRYTHADITRRYIPRSKGSDVCVCVCVCVCVPSTAITSHLPDLTSSNTLTISLTRAVYPANSVIYCRVILHTLFIHVYIQ